MSERRPSFQLKISCRGERDNLSGAGAIAGMTQGRDPVCDMTVPAYMDIALDYQGRHFMFCSVKCRTKFACEAKRRN